MDSFGLRVQNLIVVGLVVAGLVLLPAMVTASPGNTPLPASTPRCFWENPCTPTPGPSQPTATATPTVDPSATATATPPPNATAALGEETFNAPEFGMPTGIPDTDLNSLYPAPTPWNNDPIEAPSPIAITINPISTPNFPTVTLSMPATSTVTSISGFTIPVSLTITPAPITGLAVSTYTNSGPFSDTVYSLHSYADGIFSYTNAISGNIAALQGTSTITVITAPAWYAPALPRPFANVGWTFEQQIGPGDTVPTFTTESFAAFAGYVISLPFSFMRAIWDTLTRFGPIGLFLAWLFIMAIFVFTMEATRFFISLFAVSVRFIVRLVELLGGWIPTGG